MGVCCLGGKKEELLLFVLDQRLLARRAYTKTVACNRLSPLLLLTVSLQRRLEEEFQRKPGAVCPLSLICCWYNVKSLVCNCVIVLF